MTPNQHTGSYPPYSPELRAAMHARLAKARLTRGANAFIALRAGVGAPTISKIATLGEHYGPIRKSVFWRIVAALDDWEREKSVDSSPSTSEPSVQTQ